MNREWWKGKKERGLFLPFPALLSLPLLLIINSDIPQKVIARDWGQGRCMSAVMRKPDWSSFLQSVDLKIHCTSLYPGLKDQGVKSQVTIQITYPLFLSIYPTTNQFHQSINFPRIAINMKHCALRKIEGSPVHPGCPAYVSNKNRRSSILWEQKLGTRGPPGTARAQPCAIFME